MNVIRDYAAGTGKIAQYGDWNRATTTEESKFEAAYAENADTVGYIVLEGTNIDYPIMFDRTGEWYYNDHTFDKEKSESAAIYTYYYGYDKNIVVTGHNSRPSGSMFHQLHHLQEFNVGETNCLQKKYCGKELTDLPDFNVYADRVWTLNLYGVETHYEIFAMYETKAPADEEMDGSTTSGGVPTSAPTKRAFSSGSTSRSAFPKCRLTPMLPRKIPSSPCSPAPPSMRMQTRTRACSSSSSAWTDST